VHLTREQFRIAESLGCRFQPAAPEQVSRFSMQRRVFWLEGTAYLALRGDGFYETAATLAHLLQDQPPPAEAAPEPVATPPESAPAAPVEAAAPPEPVPPPPPQPVPVAEAAPAPPRPPRRRKAAAPPPAAEPEPEPEPATEAPADEPEPDDDAVPLPDDAVALDDTFEDEAPENDNDDEAFPEPAAVPAAPHPAVALAPRSAQAETARLVAAYVASTALPWAELPELIRSVHRSVLTLAPRR
jgi:hypothetical protein